MFCKNCGNEIDNDNNFCPNCGLDLSADRHDLYGVTKIPTFLFWLFSFLTLGIYYDIKMYRITGDLRKLISKRQSVSFVVITAFILICIIENLYLLCNNIMQQELLSLSANINLEILDAYIGIQHIQNAFFILIIPIIRMILYCDIVYKTLNNIKYIARQKQNKLLKYNKFWAFIFGFLYVNFVFNTYDQRLVEDK